MPRCDTTTDEKNSSFSSSYSALIEDGHEDDEVGQQCSLHLYSEDSDAARVQYVSMTPWPFLGSCSE